MSHLCDHDAMECCRFCCSCCRMEWELDMEAAEAVVAFLVWGGDDLRYTRKRR